MKYNVGSADSQDSRYSTPTDDPLQAEQQYQVPDLVRDFPKPKEDLDLSGTCGGCACP